MRPGPLLLIGERDPERPAHVGIEVSIAAFERETGQKVPFVWLATSRLSQTSTYGLLTNAAGIWAVPGGFENPDGALTAIEFARKHDIPFLGTCAGFQFGLMEFAKNVVGRPAGHREPDPTLADPLIVALANPLLGAEVRVLASPEFSGILGGCESLEVFNCRYGLRGDLESAFDHTGLRFVARDELGQARAFVLTSCRFFVGTLFQPERRALAGELHPVIRSFLKTVATPAATAKSGGESTINLPYGS